MKNSLKLIGLFLLFIIIGCTNKEDRIMNSLENVDKKLGAITNQLSVLTHNDSIMNIQLRHFPTSSPVSISDMQRITSTYSERTDPITGEKKMHWGIDYAAPQGTEVFASADGIVKEANRKNGYGNRISINHMNGYETSYSHLNSMIVKPNQKIKKGDRIGTVGSTGYSTGNHLHYEITFLSKKINPNNFI